MNVNEIIELLKTLSKGQLQEIYEKSRDLLHPTPSTKERSLEHYVLNATEKRYVIKDLYHIQNVNAFHSRLKEWLKSFKGLASKYLDNYLAWFNFVEKYQFEHIKSKRKGMLI